MIIVRIVIDQLVLRTFKVEPKSYFPLGDVFLFYAQIVGS